MKSVKSSKGCQFVSVVYESEQKMNKRNNPYYGRVTKRVVAQMQFGYSYENACNNRCADGVTFVADSLPWGAWVEGMRNKVIEHKDMFYLRTYCVRNAKPRTFYLLDGHLASAEEYAEFSQWLKPASTSAKQSDAGLAEEFQVKPRDYKFKSIVAITLNHTRIMLVDDKAE